MLAWLLSLARHTCRFCAICRFCLPMFFNLPSFPKQQIVNLATALLVLQAPSDFCSGTFQFQLHVSLPIVVPISCEQNLHFATNNSEGKLESEIVIPISTPKFRSVSVSVFSARLGPPPRPGRCAGPPSPPGLAEPGPPQPSPGHLTRAARLPPGPALAALAGPRPATWPAWLCLPWRLA